VTGSEWLLIACLFALAGWVAAGVIDALAGRRPLPPITQPVRHTPPLPSPIRADMTRARTARAAAADGRHRRPEGPQ